MEGMLRKTRGVLEEGERQRVHGLVDVNNERAKGLPEVGKAAPI
jgi:hypothetical protein